MSTRKDELKTMAHMVNNRVADIETTRRIEAQKEQRLQALKEHCKTLTGESLWAMQKHYPELFTNEDERELIS